MWPRQSGDSWPAGRVPAWWLCARHVGHICLLADCPGTYIVFVEERGRACGWVPAMEGSRPATALLGSPCRLRGGDEAGPLPTRAACPAMQVDNFDSVVYLQFFLQPSIPPSCSTCLYSRRSCLPVATRMVIHPQR